MGVFVNITSEPTITASYFFPCKSRRSLCPLPFGQTNPFWTPLLGHVPWFSGKGMAARKDPIWFIPELRRSTWLGGNHEGPESRESVGISKVGCVPNRSFEKIALMSILSMGD